MIKFSFFLSILLSLVTVIVVVKDDKALPFFKQKLQSELSLTKEAEFKVKINKVGLKQLERMANDSLKRGFLTSDARQWVKCKVIKDGISADCKIRLRGDLPKHWEGIKRSYRIKFKEASPLWGWKKVDLILPEDKGHESELVAYEMARKLKLIAPGAKFSNISLNGVNTGTYLVKQGDSGSLFEVNGRTESMTIKENNIWWYAQEAGGIYNKLFYQGQWDANNLRTLPLLYAPAFNGEAASPLTYSRFAQFMELVSQGENLDRHLNVDYFYAWLATAMTFGSVHSTLPDNLLWYANGSTGLMEPIIYDVLHEKLWADPFIYFPKKSFILKNILKETWHKGGKEIFWNALNTIEVNLRPAYLEVIRQRDELNNKVLRKDEYFSESAALLRLKHIENNIVLIKQHYPQASF